MFKRGLFCDQKFFDFCYFGKMLYGDEYFAKIVQKLDELGLIKKILIIVIADYGEVMDPWYEGYSKNVNICVIRYYGKLLYDEEIHVLLFFRFDGVLKLCVVDD